MSKTETRAGQPADFRADKGEPIKVAGYAAVFNERTDIGGLFIEQISPGAFTEAIERDDVVFVVNHEGLPLARTRSGTLKLTEDERGLFMESELDASDPDVQQIVPKMQRGDLDKMSFAFIVEREEWDESGDIPERIIRQVALRDVSIVTTPAYEGTEIGLRSLDEHRKAKTPSNQNLRRKRLKQAEWLNRTR